MKPQKKISVINSKFTESLAALVLLLFFSLILIFNDLSKPGLPAYDDCTKAQRAWEMLQSNDLLTPRLGGEENFDHPPLFFWFVAIAFKMFGKTEFAARLFGALFALLTVWITYLIGREIKSRTVGWWAAYFLTTSYIFLKVARRVTTDIPFMLLSSLSLLFFIRGYKKIKTDSALSKEIMIDFILFGVFAGLTGLTKSVFIIFPVLSPLICLLILKEIKKQTFLPYIIGAFTAAITTGWWYLYEVMKYGDKFLQGFFGGFLVPHTQGASNLGKFGVFSYIYEILRHFWPWLPLVVWAIWWIIKSRTLKENRLLLLLIIHSVFPLMLLSFFGDRTIRYILFTFPPILVITSFSVVNRLKEKSAIRAVKYALLFLLLLCTYLVIRPIDLSKIRNEDYLMLGKMQKAGKIDLSGREIYHLGGEYGSHNNPMLFYTDRSLTGIIRNRTDLKDLLRKKQPFFLLVNFQDLNEGLKIDFRIALKLKTKYFMKSNE